MLQKHNLSNLNMEKYFVLTLLTKISELIRLFLSRDVNDDINRSNLQLQSGEMPIMDMPRNFNGGMPMSNNSRCGLERKSQQSFK
jgi:hypothetical protein